MQIAPPTAASRSIAVPHDLDLRAHADAKAAAHTDLTGGRQGKVTSETLPNGVRLIVAERPGAQSTKVQLGVGARTYQDPHRKLGMAHLLEHHAIEGSPTRSAAQQEAMRGAMGNNWNAYTDQDSIVYYGVFPQRDAAKGAALIGDMYKHPALTGKRVPQEKAAVQNEMIYWDGSLQGEDWHLQARLLFGDTPATNNIIGTRPSTDAITSKDMRAFHDRYFTGKNTVALVEGDPAHLPLATLRRELGALPAGERLDNDNVHPVPVPGKAMQVVNDPTTGTVRLNVSVPVDAKVVDGMKTPQSLLTTSLGETLNNRLRRYHHLTYGAKATLDPADETSKPTSWVLNVSANVAPENAQRAMTDLVATLKDARDGFGPKTLEQHKQEVLSNVRGRDVVDPTVSERAEDAFQSALRTEGVDIPPARAENEARSVRARIGAVDLKTFAKDAGKVIDLSNLKVLATGPLPDGGASLKAAIEQAGVDTAGMRMNPLDLSMYRDMGIAVPPGTVPGA
jgi:predicted Zn-dependent peptidase